MISSGNKPYLGLFVWFIFLQTFYWVRTYFHFWILLKLALILSFFSSLIFCSAANAFPPLIIIIIIFWGCIFYLVLLLYFSENLDWLAISIFSFSFLVEYLYKKTPIFLSVNLFVPLAKCKLLRNKHLPLQYSILNRLLIYLKI